MRPRHRPLTLTAAPAGFDRTTILPARGVAGGGADARAAAAGLLAAVPDGVPDVEDDLLSLADEDGDDLTAVVRAVNRAEDQQGPAPEPDESDDEPALDEPVESELEAKDGPEPAPATDEPAASGSSEPETEPTPERKRRTGRRASVPSWDEIMLGKRQDS